MAAGSSLPSPHLEERPNKQSQFPHSKSFPVKIGEAYVPMPSIPSPSTVSKPPPEEPNNSHSITETIVHLPKSKLLANLHGDASLLKPTYLQVVQGSNHSTGPSTSQVLQSVIDLESFPLKQISTYQGKPAVVFPLSEKNSLIDKLKYVLVGKFSHGMPTLNRIRLFFSALKLQQSCNITMFDKNHIFIECFCKADFYYIWLHLTWVIEGFSMRVLKWSADFNPTKESAIVPVWVRLEGIPLYMFDEMSLLAIANTIGKPIKVDPRNVARTIVHSARICVELDASKELLDSFWVSFEDDVTKVVIEGFMVKVRYDEVPLFCEFCSHIGHGFNTCKRRERSGLQEAIVVQDKQGLRASKYIQTAAELGSDTGLEVGTKCSNMGSQHMAVLPEKNYFEEAVNRENLCENNGRASASFAGAMVVHEAIQQVLLNKASSAQADTCGKGMRQIRGMLVNSYVQAPTHGLQLMNQVHGMKNLQTEKEHNEVPAKMLNGVEKSAEDSRQLHRPDKVCDCASDLSVELVKTDQGFAGQGDFRQLEGMLANKKLQSASTASSSRTTAYPKAQKLIQKQKKVYQVKKQPQLSSKALEITKNSFAILEEEVLIEDLPLEEGELVVADVCVPSAISSPLVHDATTVTDSDVRSAGNVVKIVNSPVAGETGPGLSTARDLSIGKESKRVEAGSQELADGKVVAVQKISAGVSVTSGKTTAAGAGAAGHALAGVDRTELQEHTSAGNAKVGLNVDGRDLQEHEIDRHAIATAWEGTAGAAAGDHGAGESDVAGESAAQVLQQFEMQNMGKSELNLQGTIDRVGEPVVGGFAVNKKELAAGNVANKSIPAPRVLSAEAVEFSPSTVAKNTKVGGHSWADLVTTNAMDQLQERMNRLKGDSFPAAPSLAASTWVPPNMSKHLARELKKFRKHRITQNWQDMEEVSDEESEEGDLDEKVGSQMLKGGTILSDDMSDIPRPFKIKSAPNSPKGRNNTYDSNTYLLSRGLS